MFTLTEFTETLIDAVPVTLPETSNPEVPTLPLTFSPEVPTLPPTFSPLVLAVKLPLVVCPPPVTPKLPLALVLP